MAAKQDGQVTTLEETVGDEDVAHIKMTPLADTKNYHRRTTNSRHLSLTETGGMVGHFCYAKYHSH